MQPLTRAELVDLGAYETLRSEYRRRVIAYKGDRRVAIGDRVALLFEDRETLRFQVQEMLHVERIHDPERVQHELDVYNELMPADDEFSATLFVEIPDLGSIRSELDRLIGIDEHVALRLGEGDSARRVPARFDPKQMEEDRISAVQYIRFVLDPEARRLFDDERQPARLEIDHPRYRATTELPEGVRESLRAGLARDPAPLLEPAAETPGAETLHDEPGLRVIRAPGREGLAIECRPGHPSLLATLQRFSKPIVARHGRCRVRAELGPTPERWYLSPP